ncbi:hypothetical protein C8Q74DRAFT_1365795 [Fomes fomentarius]|nr:hypothetical protein C8Q74DRAFT_1365795 [Fomes fomentarius]
MFNVSSLSTFRSALAGPQAAIFLCIAQAALVSAQSDDPENVKPGDTLDGSGWGKTFAVIFHMCVQFYNHAHIVSNGAPTAIAAMTSLALLWSCLFRPHTDPKTVLPIHNGGASYNGNQAPHPVANETKQSWDGNEPPPSPSVTSLNKDDVRPPPPYPWELPLYRSRESSDNGYPNASRGALEPGAFLVPHSLHAPPPAHVKNNFYSY